MSEVGVSGLPEALEGKVPVDVFIIGEPRLSTGVLLYASIICASDRFHCLSISLLLSDLIAQCVFD